MRQYSRTPTADDRLSKLTWPAVRRILALAMPHRRILMLAGVLMLMSTAITLSIPLLGRSAINDVAERQELQHLDRYVLGLAGLILLSAILGFTQSIIAARTGNRIVMDLRLRLFEHLQRLPVSFYDRTRSGDLTSHLSNDAAQIQTTLTDDIVNALPNSLKLIGGIVVLFGIDWRLSSIVVTLLIVTMMFFVFFGRRLRQLNRKALDALSDAMGAMSEAMANIRLVKAFAREGFEDKRAREKLETVFGLNMRSAVSESAMGAVAGAGFMLMMLGVIWYGGRSVLQGTLQIGDLVAFFMTAMIIGGPMSSIAALYTRLQRAVGAADRLFSILDDQPEVADSLDSVPFPIGRGAVEFREVHFSYAADVPVLTGLNLHVNEAEVTALVGPSGAGKSTVSSLLYRFYEPQAGEILIDGVPIRSIRREDLRANVGIVPQDPLLFNGTIRENIRYGRLNASDTEVETAAREANVEEFVTQFPEKYETMIGERGITLSGGQRQRVAIARALLKDPRILVLDEATSALDTKSEALVREALDRLMQGRTTLVIAHRLSTVQNADQIAVLAEGRIVEVGTHEQLLQERGRYAELYEFVVTA